jgi:hypothetical protein
MGKFIITEEEKNRIKSLYGQIIGNTIPLISEQSPVNPDLLDDIKKNSDFDREGIDFCSSKPESSYDICLYVTTPLPEDAEEHSIKEKELNSKYEERVKILSQNGYKQLGKEEKGFNYLNNVSYKVSVWKLQGSQPFADTKA